MSYTCIFVREEEIDADASEWEESFIDWPKGHMLLLDQEGRNGQALGDFDGGEYARLIFEATGFQLGPWKKFSPDDIRMIGNLLSNYQTTDTAYKAVLPSLIHLFKTFGDKGYWLVS